LITCFMQQKRKLQKQHFHRNTTNHQRRQIHGFMCEVSIKLFFSFL
jgi:hypothetical protein